MYLEEVFSEQGLNQPTAPPTSVTEVREADATRKGYARASRSTCAASSGDVGFR